MFLRIAARGGAYLLVVQLLTVAAPLVAAEEWAGDKNAADLLPPTTVLYAWVPQPAHTLQALLQHPLFQRLVELPAYQQALGASPLRPVKAVVAAVETELNMQWPEILANLTGGGLHVAVDGEANGVVILARSRDAETSRRARDIVLTFVRGMAQMQGQPDPVQAAEYRGVDSFGIGPVHFGLCGEWLVVTSQVELGRQIVDRYLDGNHDGLADQAHFVQAADTVPDEPTAWGYADVRTIREAGTAPELFRGRTNNPLAELVVGGLLGNLQHTSLVAAAFELQETFVRLTVSSPHDPEWMGEPREFYFGPTSRGVAPPLLDAPGALLTLATYRDVAGMWLHAGDLFDERVNDNLAQAESGLSTLFGGKDFGEEILTTLEPRIQLTLARQDFGDRLPQPAVKLPAVAATLRLRDPDEVRDDFRRTFQSLMGFFNVAGATQGQPQLDFTVEKQGSVQLLSSEFVAEGEERTSRQARINFNFSPSVAFSQDLMVISSSTELARKLAAAAAADGGGEDEEPSNTRARLDAHVLQQVLADNRQQLIAQNILEEGNSHEEAEQEIDQLLAIVGWFRDATLKLAAVDAELKLDVQVNFAE